MRGALVVDVARWFELKRGVLDDDREVSGDAGLQLVEHPGSVPVVEARVVDDDVRGENGQAGGDL